jgi:two-component system cell cycle sensor histidine kinase/response regulator CckA
MEVRSRLNPTTITFAYGILAIGWILLSDTVLSRLALPPRFAFLIGMLKGVVFVTISMSFLYLLLQGMVRKLERNRIRHEAKLKESEERFSKAFRSSPVGFAISAIHDGRFIEANEAFAAMLGYSRSELIGRASLELGVWVEPHHRTELFQMISECKPILRYATRFRRKDSQTLQVELSAEQLQLLGKPCLLVIARDVTRQRELEQQFQEAQKMEAVAQVAAGVAHDFKNHLMVISACTDMLEVNGEKNAGLRNQIQTTVTKSVTLARQLMAFSRRQKLTPEVLDLGSTLPELWKMLPRLTGPSINSSLEVGATVWSIYADRSQFEQIVMNLAVNARDAMPTGGSLKISASNLTLQTDTSCNGVFVPAGDYVQLKVSDTGHGMSDQVLSQIFQPFFTTKAKDKGTGLGLAAVHSIVKQSGGFISVESETGRGSTFEILWPRHSQNVVIEQLVTKSVA